MYFDDERTVAEKKIILLYIFYYINIPLSKDQLSNIVLENSLLDYFTLNQFIIELEESALIRLNEKTEDYQITDDGVKTLIAFEQRIDPLIRGMINKYIDKNKREIRAEKETSTNVIRKGEDEYVVVLKAFENNITLVEISLDVVSFQQAEQICRGWKKNAQVIYKDLIDSLTH